MSQKNSYVCVCVRALACVLLWIWVCVYAHARVSVHVHIIHQEMQIKTMILYNHVMSRIKSGDTTKCW